MPTYPTPEELGGLLSIPAARRTEGFDGSADAGDAQQATDSAPLLPRPDAGQADNPDQDRLRLLTEATDANAYIHARLIGIRPRYLADPDYATLAQRWQDETNRIVNNGLSFVSDDGARDFVRNEAAATLADEATAIKDQAFRGAAAAHAQSRDDYLQSLVQNLTPNPNDTLIGGGVRAYHLMIDNAVARGFVTADDALAEKRRAALALTAGQYSVLAQHDPARAIQELESGPATHPLAQHLPPDVTQGLIVQAKDNQQAQQIDAERAPQVKAEQIARASDGAESKYVTDLLSDNPTVSAADINADNALTTDAKRRLLIAAKTAFDPEPPPEVSNATAVDLLNRVRLPNGDPQKITAVAPVIDAFNANKLTKTDFSLVQKQLADLQSPDGETRGKDRQDYVDRAAPAARVSTAAATDPARASSDPDAVARRYDLERRIDQKIDRYRWEGKDPSDLFDSTKPDYFGRALRLPAYDTEIGESDSRAPHGRRGPEAADITRLNAPDADYSPISTAYSRASDKRGITLAAWPSVEGNDQRESVGTSAPPALRLAGDFDHVKRAEDTFGKIRIPTELPPSGLIDPHKIDYIHDSFGGEQFGDQTPIEDTVRQLRGGLDPRKIPPIRIFEMGGTLHTLDHRRVYAAREAGVMVHYRLATPGEIANAAVRGAFSRMPGESTRVRGARGGAE